MLRNHRAERADLNRCILRSRRRTEPDFADTAARSSAQCLCPIWVAVTVQFGYAEGNFMIELTSRLI